MKKSRFFVFAPLLFLLPSCGGNASVDPQLNDFKALLSKQDLSPVYHKVFTATFTQNYDFFSSIHQEDQLSTRFYSYRGGGAFGCVYSVSEEAYKEISTIKDPDFFDYFARGTGGYGLTQSANVSSYRYEKEGGDAVTLPLGTENFLQTIQANFNDEDVQVHNSLIYSEGNDGSNTRFQNFNGLVDKQALFDSISVRSLSDLFARTNLYDGQRSCETLDRIYEETLQRLSKNNDSELSSFIQTNHIQLEEDSANILVRFELADEDIVAKLSETELIPGTLKGTLTYDKESGSFLGFDYKIAHMVDEGDPALGKVSSASMEFTAVGYSKNEIFPEDIYIAPDPVVYEDGNAFLNDMIENLIPDIA